MSVFISSVAGAAAQFFDNSGNVLTGGKLYTYLAGTTTFADTYTSSTGTFLNTNPIILDSAGRVPEEIWFAENQLYKFVLTDADDVLLGTWDNLVSVNEIVDGSITTAKLADGAVTTVKIADANVTTAKIAALNITTALIANSNVTTAKIADLNVTTGKLADNAVTTIKITDSNVTTAKIADANVTTVKIADANVTPAKLSQPYTVDTAELLSGTSVTFTDIPSWATEITVSFFDVTISGTSRISLNVGTAGGIVSSNYKGTAIDLANGVLVTGTNFSTYLTVCENLTAAINRQGIARLVKTNNNTWTYSCNCSTSNAFAAVTVAAGSIDAGAALTQIQFSTPSTFTGGTVNISYQ